MRVLLAAALIAFTCTCIYFGLVKDRECRQQGGVLVEGVFGFVCVAGVKK